MVDGHCSLSKDREGNWICGECHVVFVIDTSRPNQVPGMPHFLGAAEDRVCIAPLGTRLWSPIRNAYWTFVILATQTPILALHRLGWFFMGDAYHSGCRWCKGTGQQSSIRVPSGETHHHNCNYCNSYHD